jgi:hypothetical protein
MSNAKNDEHAQQSFNMEQSNKALTMLNDTKTTVNVMKIRPTEIKRDDNNANIDQIDTLLDEKEDMLDMAGEVQNALAQNYSTPVVSSKFESA